MFPVIFTAVLKVALFAIFILLKSTFELNDASLFINK